MNKKTSYIIIFSLLVVLTIGIIFTDYVKQLGTILADASVPNPGHSLSEIEGYENLATKAYVDNALSGISGSNWTISGSDIYRPSGNVGIGTASPGAKLTIADNGSPMGARFLDIGDDVYLTDIDLSNTLGIYGIQDITRSRLKLGSTGGIISGYNNNIGINQALPAYRLDVNGTGRFTDAVIVGDPTLDSHAATKEYVDSHSGGLPTGGTDGAVLRMTSSGPIWDAPLTWPGSTHSVYDCVKIGGTEFDTGSGTICRLPSGTVPPYWTQAENWARYYPTMWGGDVCGRHTSFASTAEFANELTTHVYPTTDTSYTCGGCTYGCSSNYWIENPGCVDCGFQQFNFNSELVEHETTNRVEVGIY
ncbi:MAG: hypothetical protein GYA00_01420 [Parcubacteria group bacterium]|nr:hypothetical protein [Parcubacteria group bacterium]